MVPTVEVLKHEIATPLQSHNYKSIDFKFGDGDYVHKFINPAVIRFCSMYAVNKFLSMHYIINIVLISIIDTTDISDAG